MSGEKRHFVVVRRHEVVVYGETRAAVCARTVEAESAEEAASGDMGTSVVELRVIPVDDVPAIDLATVRAWRESKGKREQEGEESAELAHALEVVAKHREKMGEAK